MTPIEDQERRPEQDEEGGNATSEQSGERRWRRYQSGVGRETMPEIPARHFAGFLFNKTVMAYELMRAQWRRRLGMNTHERLALEYLWDEGTLSMGELGSRLGLSRAAITSLVDRMEAGGYLDRASDPLDRRRTLITARIDIAKEKIYPMAAGFGKAVTEFAESLEPAEWAAVVRFMDVVTRESQNNAAHWASLDEDELHRALDEDTSYES